MSRETNSAAIRAQSEDVQRKKDISDSVMRLLHRTPTQQAAKRNLFSAVGQQGRSRNKTHRPQLSPRLVSASSLTRRDTSYASNPASSSHRPSHVMAHPSSPSPHVDTAHTSLQSGPKRLTPRKNQAPLSSRPPFRPSSKRVQPSTPDAYLIEEHQGPCAHHANHKHVHSFTSQSQATNTSQVHSYLPHALPSDTPNCTFPRNGEISPLHQRAHHQELKESSVYPRPAVAVQRVPHQTRPSTVLTVAPTSELQGTSALTTPRRTPLLSSASSAFALDFGKQLAAERRRKGDERKRVFQLAKIVPASAQLMQSFGTTNPSIPSSSKYKASGLSLTESSETVLEKSTDVPALPSPRSSNEEVLTHVGITNPDDAEYSLECLSSRISALLDHGGHTTSDLGHELPEGLVSKDVEGDGSSMQEAERDVDEDWEGGVYEEEDTYERPGSHEDYKLWKVGGGGGADDSKRDSSILRHRGQSKEVTRSRQTGFRGSTRQRHIVYRTDVVAQHNAYRREWQATVDTKRATKPLKHLPHGRG